MDRAPEIFAEAVELPKSERSAFLERACGVDRDLRKRVELLIAGYDAAGLFMEDSPVERPSAPPQERIGSKIDRYTLIRKIGEGGCGVVYLAEQNEPVRRQVALKVIKLGMDTRNVIARFEAERQALALMDHPDIARVLDAGSTEAGRPFFVMEFVDGVPITKFCDEHSLSMDARLELFIRVCVALQHAHQKGIIHRDLKPSNILVAMRDGVPAPKVIDFGIAKATQGRLTEQTLVTGFDQFIGTPAYMSPEQAELRDLDIDTRSDVYSLGVLLYELLTGRPPYDPKSLVRAGIEEIRRIIREVDPPRPSTRVSTLGDADLATVARLRSAAPLQLTSVLRGDLDWIAMRCLEKDRERRYGTAVELADDVRRHLHQEPVAARPPDTLYRLQKFVARNRLACTSAAAVAVALILGTVVSARQAVRATRAERDAQTERAETQRQREQAEALLTFMLGDFRTGLKKVGRLDLLDSVGEQAMSYFAALDPRTLSDTVLARQAKALTQIGETRTEQARYPEATAAFTTAYQRAAALAARHPRDPDMLFERAQAEYWIGFIARRRGDFATTREWFTRYRDTGAALVALEGKKLRAQRELTSGEHNLAVVELDQGNLVAAEKGFLAEKIAVNEMLAANASDIELHHRLADIASWFGRVAEADGRFADAIEHYREMSKRIEELIAQEPAVPRWKSRLADSQFFLAHNLVVLGRLEEAAATYARLRPTFDALVEQDSKNQQWQLAALNVRVHQSALLLAGRDFAAVAPLLDETRTRLEALVAAEPSARVFTRRLAAAWMLEGRLRFLTGRDDALPAAERAIALAEQLIRENRADNWTLWEFGQAGVLAGRIEQARGRADIARRRWEGVLAVLAPRAPNSNDWLILDPAAQAYVLAGQADQARPLIERLQRFGYRPIDPLATPLLGVAP
jgi:eukaryotic-like serine/threonine-protein kinase